MLNKEDVFKKIMSFDYDDHITVRDYSGRGMYGRKCLGIDCNDPLECFSQLVSLFCNEYEDASDVREALECLGDPKWDSMGLDYILYFPMMKWIEEESEEE